MRRQSTLAAHCGDSCNWPRDAATGGVLMTILLVLIVVGLLFVVAALGLLVVRALLWLLILPIRLALMILLLPLRIVSWPARRLIGGRAA